MLIRIQIKVIKKNQSQIYYVHVYTIYIHVLLYVILLQVAYCDLCTRHCREKQNNSDPDLTPQD